MRRLPRRSWLLSLLAAPSLPAAAQEPGPPPERDLKLPNGRSQREEMLKADHERNLKDTATLVDLAGQLRSELQKNDRHVLSVSSIRKTEEIEKLAKKIRARLRRF